MSQVKDFPYTSVFESNVSYGGLFENSSFYSQASLEGLRPLIPDYHVDLSKNIDLLAFAANACSAGIANKNDDLFEPAAAIETLSMWQQKMVNDNHDRKKIVGHLLTSSLSSQNDSIIISPQEAIASKQPFNVSVGGVVYRIVDRELADDLEQSSDPESPSYKSVSLSFEIGFPEFGLALGSDNFFEAEIIRNQNQVNELKGNLKIYGGNGKTKDGQSIYRLIEKNHLPLAVALTRKPAAKMPYGTITSETPIQTSARKTTISLSVENNSDKTKKTSVTQNILNMEKLELILEEIKASMIANKVKEESVASMTKDFAEKIKEANEGYLSQINEAKAAREKAEKESAEIKASLDTQAKELAETKEKLTKLEADSQAKASAELFSARMAEFDAEFDLDEEDKKALAADIKALDNSDESFAAFKGKMNVFMKDKNKKAKEEKAKEAKASIDKLVAEKLAEVAKASGSAKLSDKELAEKALEQAKASEKGVIPNNNGSQGEQKSLREKYAAAFSKENVTISK